MKRNIILISIVILIAAAFFSCDNLVGLGAKLNLDPPVVTIIKPDFMQNISNELIIEGTASDLQEIVHLFVTIERVSKNGNPWKMEWHGERGNWRSRKSEGSSWETSNNAVWSVEGKGFVNWSIYISMEGAEDGEYLITVGAENNVVNRGVQEQRRVIIDKEGPVTRVLLPTLEFENTNEVSYSYPEQVEPSLSQYKLEDPSYLNKLFNQDVRIQYEVSDDFSLNTISFQLADNLGNIYYNPENIPVENAGWSGKVEIKEDEIDLYAGIDDGKTAPFHFQLISYASDKAGNKKIKSHGWFVYWPDSDRPWVSGIGHASNPRGFEVYPESDMQLMSYDDDGVHSVSYEILKWEFGVGSTLVSSGTRKNEPLLEGSNPSTFFSFSIPAPKDCSEYVIYLDCEDVYGTSGIRKIRYFFVMDINTPAIEINKPVTTETMFGNNLGNIAIEGKASDGYEPVEVLLAWIKPGNNEDQFNYISPESDSWDIVTGARSGTGSDSKDYWQDATGNRIWKLDLTNQVTTGGRTYKDFNKTLNLFNASDFGISASVPLITQTFIFRVKGNTGKAITKLHSVRGDITPPKLGINGLQIMRNGSQYLYITQAQINDPSYSLPNLEVDDQINIDGTWDDDSFAVWNNVSRMGEFTVTWNTHTVPAAQIQANKTWKAGPFTLNAEEVLNGGGVIEARLKDFGGNMTITSLSARADTNVPVLMAISSENSDGSYNTGKTIDIYIEFNKAVRYEGSGATLALNSGRSVTYHGPARPGEVYDHRHVFRYTINSTDTNVSELTVNTINTTDSHWKDSTGNSPRMQIPSGRNLGDIKKIRIDTAAPTISKVEASNETGHYNTGKTIYLKLTFNEDISFNPGAGTQASLALNVGGNGAGISPMLMGQDAILFTYLIGNGENSSALAVNSFSIGNSSITDIAGNPLTNITIPAAQNIVNNGRTITIDTTAPLAPTINTTADPDASYTEPQTFTISGEANAVIEYQIDDGPWISYTTTVTLSSAAVYTIKARQTDRAGNESPESAPRKITIAREDVLLQSLGGSTPGTYTIGNIIELKLNLSPSRAPISVSGTPRLAINVVKNPQTLVYAAYSKTEGSSIVFTYTVAANDSVTLLEINSLDLNGASVTAGGANVNTELMADFTGHPQKFSFYSPISIRTDIPNLQSAVLSNKALTLTFSEDIYKGTGNITLLQPNDTYRAPAVLTESDYNRFGGSALDLYYTVGTNGTNASGEPDKSKKYILNFSVDPNLAALKTVLTNAGANRVIIPVVSGAVTISGAVMTINLEPEWGYNLRVRGVEYGLTIQNGIVRDEQNNYLAGNQSGTTTRTVYNPGVNEPFIRVQKNRGEFTTQAIPNADPTMQNVNYWVSGAQMTRQNPNSSEWVMVPSHYVHSRPGGAPETTTNNMASDLSYASLGSSPSNYFLKGGNISLTQPTSGNWASVRDFTIVLGDNPTTGVSINEPTVNRNFHIPSNHTASNGGMQGNIYTNAGGQISIGWNPPGSGGYNTAAAPIWMNPYQNTVSVGHTHNVGDFRVGQAWINLDTAGIQKAYTVPAGEIGWVPVRSNEILYLKLGTGVWHNAEWYNNPPWGGQSQSNIQTGEYWVRRTGTGNGTWTTTDMSGTAGWIRVTIQEPVGGAGTALTTPVTSQPRTARVRIDSQTPTAQIRYGNRESEQDPQTGTANSTFNGESNPSVPSFNIVAPTTTNRLNGYEFVLLENDDTYKGFVFGISAQARLAASGQNPEAISEIVYEKVTRSVVTFNFNPLPQNWSTTNTDGGATGNLKARAAAMNKALQLWLRGGDDISGQNSIPGFPLSWDEKDTKGIRLMTNTNPGGAANSGFWYWMSWEITDTAYIYFLAGTTGNASTLADIRDNGPLDWAWGKNAWAVQQHRYPLHPGGSLSFTRGTVVTEPATSTFEFYDNFSGNR